MARQEVKLAKAGVCPATEALGKPVVQQKEKPKTKPDKPAQAGWTKFFAGNAA